MKAIRELVLANLPTDEHIFYDVKNERYYRITDNGILQICEIDRFDGRYRVRYSLIPMIAGTYPYMQFSNGKAIVHGMSGGACFDAAMVCYEKQYAWNPLDYDEFSNIPTDAKHLNEALNRINGLLVEVNNEFLACDSIISLYQYSKAIDDLERLRQPENKISNNYNQDYPFKYSHISGICGAAYVLSYMGKYLDALQWLGAIRSLMHVTDAANPMFVWLNNIEKAIHADNPTNKLSELYQMNYVQNCEYAATIGIDLPKTEYLLNLIT